MANLYDALLNYLVWPTEADHHGDDYGVGSGLIFLEKIMTKDWYNGSTQVNRVVSGFALPDSGSATNATIGYGTAIIAGYLITGTDDIVTVDFTDTTSYVYLALQGDGITVTQPIIKVETARLTGANVDKWHLLLGTVTAAGGTISTAADMRIEGRHVWGAVTHSDAGTPTVENYGSANWTVTRSSAQSVITYDNPFLFKAPTVIVASENALASTYSSTTAAATIDGTNAKIFSFHIMG
jgi:hypothetical protein